MSGKIVTLAKDSSSKDSEISLNEVRFVLNGKLYTSFKLLCLSGQEMAPTGQRPLFKDSWHHNSILWEEQFTDPTIAYITFVNVMYSAI